MIPDVLLNAAFQSTAIVTSGSTHQFQLVPHGFPSPQKTMGDLFQYGFPMGFVMVSHFKTAWLPEDKVDLFQSSASGIRA